MKVKSSGQKFVLSGDLNAVSELRYEGINEGKLKLNVLTSSNLTRVSKTISGSVWMAKEALRVLAWIGAELRCRVHAESSGPCFKLSKIYNNNSNGWH